MAMTDTIATLLADKPALPGHRPWPRYEVEASSQEVPPLEEIERGHKVACFNPVPEDEWQNMRNQVVAP